MTGSRGVPKDMAPLLLDRLEEGRALRICGLAPALWPLLLRMLRPDIHPPNPLAPYTPSSAF